MNVAVVHIVRSQCLEAAVQRFPVPVARLAVSRIQRVVSIETRVCVCVLHLPMVVTLDGNYCQFSVKNSLPRNYCNLSNGLYFGSRS
jgi:hypothetical protein